MAKTTLVRLMALGFTLALSGCGGGGSASDDDSGSTTASAAGGGMPANWKATDACSILGKGDVAEILKVKVKETQLGLVHEPGAADAGTSECRYIGEDGAAVASIMTRWSPINDNTAESIQLAKSGLAETLKGFSKGPPEDVPGLGKAAFIVPSLNQLMVYLDDARMITVTASKVPDGASGNDVAIALARKAGA
jgi:hypothetical protein